jgi:RND family efflux transporter MFP subunit
MQVWSRLRTFNERMLAAGPARVAAPLGFRRGRWVAAAGALAIVLAGALGVWSRVYPGADAHAQATSDASLPTVTFFYAERDKPKSELLLPASIQALRDTTIYARTNGYLKRWLVDIGDKVSAGQLLAEIETPELDQELQEAQAKLSQIRVHLEVARVTAERYQSLRGEDAVSPQEVDEKVGAYDARRADLAAVQAQIKRLQELRAFQRVVAPFAGTITSRNVEVGSLIAAGSASSSGWLFKLQHTDTLRVFVNVPQNYLQLVKPGMDGELLVREAGAQPFPCKVTRHAGALDPATRTVLVELQLPNKEGRLLPGMYGQLRFHMVNPEPSIIIPGTALMVGGEGIRVAALEANDTVRIKQIHLGRDYGKEVEVIQGLSEKERVINNPRDTLQDGTRVKPVLLEKKAEKKDAVKPADKPVDKPKAAESSGTGEKKP